MHDMQWQPHQLALSDGPTPNWHGTEEPWPPTDMHEEEQMDNSTHTCAAEQKGASLDQLTLATSPLPSAVHEQPGVNADHANKVLTEISTMEVNIPTACTVQDTNVAVDGETEAYGQPPQSTVDAPRDAGEDENRFDDDATRYELRPQSSKAGFTSTWMDKDETGDYDPSEERRRPKARRTRLKLREPDSIDSIFDTADEDAVNAEAALSEYPKQVVKLKFSSEAGKTAFEKHVNSLPAKAWHELDAFSTGYRLRTKNPAAVPTHGIAQHLDRPLDAPDVPADLTGHPVARGCWECLGLGIRCPLLDDERAWPCSTCLADDHDCDLVTPPIRKRACERCKRKRTPCSFAKAFHHSGPCEDCANDSYRCVAGPLKENIRPRIRYDRDYTKDPPPSKTAAKPTKTFWTCMQCREAARPCSFSDGGPGEECASCEQADSICIPEQVTTPPPQRASSRSARAPKKRLASEPAEQEVPTKRAKGPLHSARTKPIKQQTPTKPAKGSLHSAGTTKTITTKFCHPIVFNYEDADGTKPCHFCEHYSFAILGLEPKVVEVIDWEDGHGLTEVGGGHMEGGVASTRMCTTCTMGKMPMVMCPKHVMRPIPGVSPDTMDMDGALMALFSGEERKADRWCSICPSLAAYECETENPIDQCDGCGLSLCEQCMLNLTGVYDGDLQSMLLELEDEPSVEKPLGLRADFELLKQDGLLMRHVLWSTQQ